MNPELLERMKGLVNQRLLNQLERSIVELTSDLDEEDFEITDIKEFISLKLEEILG